MSPQEHHETLIKYLRVKVEQADWHGVSDAANDLRVLEAQHPSLIKVSHESQNASKDQ